MSSLLWHAANCSCRSASVSIHKWSVAPPPLFPSSLSVRAWVHLSLCTHELPHAHLIPNVLHSNLCVCLLLFSPLLPLCPPTLSPYATCIYISIHLLFSSLPPSSSSPSLLPTTTSPVPIILHVLFSFLLFTPVDHSHSRGAQWLQWLI